MITLTDVSVQRGTRQLLEHTGLTVFPGHKLGVIGANGSGKSTLFQVLLGELATDTGSCNVPRDWQIAHMAQEIGTARVAALDYVLDGDAELTAINTQIANDDIDGTALAELYAKLETIDGYTAPARAQQLLHGLGFSEGDAGRTVQEFSGGWRIRLNLARALMCRSDLLLLDEPTNHLDLDACVWLEQWLKAYAGTLVIISHDRDFLDNVVNGIVSFEQQKLYFYSGNYADFERQKAARLAEQEAVFQKQQERIGEIEQFVRRFRAKASKAKQAQSRLKELERMEKIAPAHVDSPFDFTFLTPERCPQQMLTLHDARIGYADKTILDKVNLSIHGDTRIALLGANGAGKTTFLKVLADQLPLLAGERVDGAHLKIGYFAQHQLEALDSNASCFLHIQRLSPNASEQQVRNFLGGFDFRGDRVFETIAHFSGGEKARLALAILVWQKPNLLLLDEPTNHLDIEMRHALTVALQGFEGAIVMISHDRHLIRNTVDQFWLVDHGQVQSFDGDLQDYYNYLQNKAPSDSSPSTAREEPKPAKKQDRQLAAREREKLKPLTNQLKQLERDIEKVSAALRKLDDELAQAELYDGANSQLADKLKRQGALRAELAACEETWLAVSEELEQLKND